MNQPPEGTVLDRRTLNRTLLARQLLLGRVDLPVPSTVEALVGLQAQVSRDPYISLWSRLRGFDPRALEALIAERRAVRMTLMRTTLHLVTADDAARLRAVLQEVCERGFRSSPFRRRLEGLDLAEVLALGASIVAERPRTVSELGQRLGQRWSGHDRTAMAYAVRYLVPLVQVPPRGLWRRSGAPRVTTLAAWLGLPAEPLTPVVAAPDELVRRYLRAFGPATVADIRTWSWLSGLRPVVDRLRPRLRAYRDESGRELLDVEDGIFAEASAPAPVRFLGEYDNLFLSHADRSRITGDVAWGITFARKGAFFVGGFLAGSWSATDSGDRVSMTIEPRLRVDAFHDEIEAEAHALLRFLAPDATSHAIEFAAD
jgi:hypothetical protein